MRASTTLVIRGGLFAGLLGYAIVVVYFAAANLVAGRSLFHTAALLGSAMFFGLKDPATLTISAAPRRSCRSIWSISRPSCWWASWPPGWWGWPSAIR